MRQYAMFELSFQTEGFVQGTIEAVFTHEDQEIRVKGFYAGDNTYKVRFLPEKVGLWHWKVTGVVSAEGEEHCEKTEHHGPVRADGTHFRYADGSWFYPFGTTVYALLHQTPEIVEQTMQSLRSSPFNKVRFCVFPKHYRFNENEPQWYPFKKRADGTWDVEKPCMSYWNHLDQRMQELNQMGIQADLILFHPYDRWGFASMPQKDNLIYLDYLLARLSAYPNIWWSLANEYDLCLEHKSMEDWEEIETFVATHDPCHHLLSNHNCLSFWDFSRPHVTHVSAQTKMLAEVPHWIQKYQKPLMVDECCYEGNIPEFWGSISAQEMTARFWRVFTSGGYCTHGETYLDEHDILWWAKGGVLKGESPKRIAFLKEVAASLPGPLDPWISWPDTMLQMDKEALQKTPNGFGLAIARFLGTSEANRFGFCAVEHVWRGRCGEQAILVYNDQRSNILEPLELPEGHTYRVEVLDTWNMTRETVLKGATGKIQVPLSGKPYCAILATMEDEKE